MSSRSTHNGPIKDHHTYQNNISNATKEADKDIIKLSQNSQKNVSQIDNIQPNIKEAASSFLQNNQIGGFGVSSSLMMGDKSNNTNSVDEEKMILEVILSGQLQDLKHFNLKNRSLNYLREFDPTQAIDKKVSPLIVAIYGGNIDHVKDLFTYKSSININYPTKKQGISPLMAACMRGQFEIMQFLVSKGADINQLSTDGLPPLYYCFSRLEEDNNYFENKNLCQKMASYLLECGASINQIVNEENKHTLLMQFCNIQEDLDYREKDINLTMIKFLISNGADIFLKNSQGLDCYDLIEKHPYINDVIRIFEQYENTMVSNNFKTTLENTTYEKSGQLIQTSPQSRNNIHTKQKKRSQITIPTNPSSSHLNIPPLQLSLLQKDQQMNNPQQKMPQQNAKQYVSKYQQNIEIEGEEKKVKPCCSILFF